MNQTPTQLNSHYSDRLLVLLHHKFLRDGFLAIDVLQHGHRDKVFAIATINRRRMVATELGT